MDITATSLVERRADLLRRMELVMGTLPGVERQVPPDMRVESSEELSHFTRRLISFETEPGERIEAYLLLPRRTAASAEKTSAVLCLHSTDLNQKKAPAGVADRPSLHYAAHLAERGYVTLAPDYSYGKNFASVAKTPFDPYAHGYASATMKGIWNHRAALDLLQSLPQVDGDRLGAIGHSLGGHNAMFLAVFDERVKAVVSSCGFTLAAKYQNGDLTGWSHSGYMPRIQSLYQCDPALLPFDFSEIVAALAPRAFFTNSPLHDSNFDPGGVADCIAYARPFYEAQGAADRLEAVYPDCAHDFPETARQAAYDFFDRWL